jgi:hypothetical protein
MTTTPLIISFPSAEIHHHSDGASEAFFAEFYRGVGERRCLIAAFGPQQFLASPAAFIDALRFVFPQDRQTPLVGGVGFDLSDGSRLDAWPTAFMYRDRDGNEEQGWFGRELIDDAANSVDGILRRLVRSESSKPDGADAPAI